MTARLYLRVRAVCCREWGCPPWEFDAAVADGRLAIEDVAETLILAAWMSPAGEVLTKYLHREREAVKRRERRQLWALVKQADRTKDPVEKEKIAAQIRALQDGR